MGNAIVTNNLTKRFGQKLAVDRVSMHVGRGDIYGFIGKNGAGKTTTMKLILGLGFADGGSIEYFDGIPAKKALRKTGCVIEAPGLYKNCTARENLKRFAIAAGAGDGQIDECLKLVGLEDAGNKKAGQFSLGMRQRLGIAIALLGRPELLILDEPINGLDPEGIRQIRDIILSLNKQGVTFIISSHLLDELSKVVTKYGIISGGVLQEEITAAELESKCSNGIIAVVDDTARALNALEGSIYAGKLTVDGDALLIDADRTEAAAINHMLVYGGVNVGELTMRHGSMEDYFITRLG